MKSNPSKSPKILFANGRKTHPFNVGGDGVTTHTLARELFRRGMQVETLGVINPKKYPETSRDIGLKLTERTIPYQHRGDSIRYTIPYPATMVPLDQLLTHLDTVIDSLCPDVMITQLEFSPEILDHCYARGLPVVLYIHDNDPTKNQPILACHNKAALVVFNSEYTKNNYESAVSVPMAILYPLFEFDEYRVKTNSRRFVTMINPVPEKGLGIILQLVKEFSDIEFLLVEGWYKPNIDFQKYPNVRYWEHQDDMRTVWAQTKLLLTPSQWEEAFGRVNVEALINGIPILASDRGGMREAVGDGGILIEQYDDPNAWINALIEMEQNTALYEQLALRGSVHAECFEVRSKIHLLLNILKKII